MTNEILDMTNKLIEPEDIIPTDDEVIRQLSDNLQDITTDDVNAMCDEMEEAKRIEDEQGIKIICNVDGSDVVYDKKNGVVSWNGVSFQVKGFIGVGDFMRKVIAAGIKPEHMMKIVRAIGY